MQDGDSFISSYESAQCTGGEYEGVFSFKKTLTKEFRCIFDDFHCTDQHLESESRI